MAGRNGRYTTPLSPVLPVLSPAVRMQSLSWQALCCIPTQGPAAFAGSHTATAHAAPVISFGVFLQTSVQLLTAGQHSFILCTVLLA